MLASLNHPHIASLYGLEQLDGRHVLVMELAEGEDLAARLRRGRLSSFQARLPVRHDPARPIRGPGCLRTFHHQAWHGGWATQWLSDLNFADDPFLSAADRERSAAAGRFAWVQAPRQEGGALVVELNLRLKAEGTSFEANILHGREACGLS